MVMDSLRYWAECFHVDGFRFDLDSTLGREGTGFDPGAGFFEYSRPQTRTSEELIDSVWATRFS